MKSILRWIVIVGVIAGLVLTYQISRSMTSAKGFEANYTTLLAGVALIGSILLSVTIYQVAALVKRVTAREFGSRLALKITIALGLMALVPGVLLYLVSYRFIESSVDTFYNERIEQALESGIKLGQTAIQVSGTDLASRATAAAQQIADWRIANQFNVDRLEPLRRVAKVDTLVLTNATGFPISTHGDALLGGRAINANDTLQLALASPQISNEQLNERTIVVRAVVAIPIVVLPVSSVSAASIEPPSKSTQDYLVVASRLSETLGRDAERLTSATAEYRQLTLQRSEIKTLFSLTLTLVLMITLFSAIAIALMLSQTITEPLTALAEATRAVAKGDYSRMNPVSGRDEFGVLTQSFNTMTRRIAEATDTMQQNQLQIESARANLETILARLQSGVLTFDGDLTLQSANAAASLILAEPMEQRIGMAPHEWAMSAAALALLDVMRRKDDGDARPKSRVKDTESLAWERQIKVVINSAERSLIVRCSQLNLRAIALNTEDQVNRQTTYILVFDDVTQLIEGERQAAWSEVARRLAHEIKNPLTPIQLSAQRIASKLQSKLQPDDAQMLARGTDTIVNQVTILKSMVDDFSMYAKASRIQMATININQLLDDVLNLYEAMPVHISRRNSVDLPPIEADAGMLRQVIHNLVQNSCDALLQGQGDSTVRVTSNENERRRAAQMTATATSLKALRGSIVIATSIEQQEGTKYVQIKITDDGPGLDPQVAARVFEPYVTTKPKGTGLGLAIVKRIIEEHHGMINLENVQNGAATGARATILLPIAQRSEKPDNAGER